MGLCFGGGNRNNIVIVPDPSTHKMLGDKKICADLYLCDFEKVLTAG